jgi:tricorn protease-like protein/C-terminal processing protease CtpA/Prc
MKVLAGRLFARSQAAQHRRTAPSRAVAALVVAAAAGLAAPLAAVARDVQPEATMLRWPGVSKSHIVFSYANQLWLAPREGGTASPVASPSGQSTFPRFSPDGQTIAFVGNYDGGREIYTVPVNGGIPTRVTHHPAGKSICGWTSDNRILYMTNAQAPLARMTQLFTIDPKGGMPNQLPMAYAGFGAVSPDGSQVAFTPHSTETRTWKRYRGGMATDIWVMDLASKSAKQITDWEGTDTLPMWGQGSDASTIYYLSDNGPEHRLNIWAYDTKSGQRTQVTSFKDDDVKWPSIGPGPAGKGEIVFQLGSHIMLLDLGTKQSKAVKITIPGARPTVRPKLVDAAERISGGAISPAGKRVVVEARGDLWSLPAKEGVPRNLSRTNGVFERDPAWSPDGRWIAYFSDESGEYELYVRPSDAREPEKDDKKPAAKDDAAKADAKDAKDAPEAKDAKDSKDAKDAKAKPGPVKLTNLGPGFRTGTNWSPDSKHIAFQDNAGNLHVGSFKVGADGVPSIETKIVDRDPYNGGDDYMSVSWSHDSAWIAYTRNEDHKPQAALWLYNVKSGQKSRATTSMFNIGGVAFDRKGDFLYIHSNRNFSSPIYADQDQSFVYAGTDTLLMIPLRQDVKHPFAIKSDEEDLKKDEPKAKKDDKKPAEAKPSEPKQGEQKPKDDAPKLDTAVTGTWEGTATTPNAPQPIPFTVRLKVTEAGKVTGSLSSAMGVAKIDGSYDKAAGQLTLNASIGGTNVTITLSVKGEEFSGSWAVGKDSGPVSGKRTSTDAPADEPEAKPADKEAAKDTDAEKKELKIDLEGFEQRAIPLPVPAGVFGSLAVNDSDKLIYVRRGARGENEPSRIMIFDPKDDSREEKVVTSGGGFEMSADGKKLLLFRGGVAVVDASAGGKAQSVPTGGMRTMIDPRAEWRQIFNDAWRLQRDYFYEPTMHGVDWARMREHYGKMIDDCVNREDVAYVLGELISELNIGHAYITSPGDVESSPTLSIGLLGADFALEKTPEGTGFKITNIYQGAAWDSDARGPLSQPVPPKSRVNVGDFLLAVNGNPVDTSKDPWASFIGLADRPTSITVNTKPVFDGKERDIVVRPLQGEANLRYRAWIEDNRQRVEKLSDGKIGYIYVPNTGVDGQSDLFRQFFGQRDKAALIIDDRWNGGGQIPTRFIELLNRPATNYWARRNGHDWTWPPDSHQGPKAMLINGLAGSGGDMFPWLFKHNKIGAVIGLRTWGGLVGISGNPGLIDGGAITVPTFGFYETDGTWGVEGHGVDPDIKVVDDPGLLAKGQDPQLEAAVKHLLAELQKNPYNPPKRPASPNRSGMGIKEEDK